MKKIFFSVSSEVSLNVV